MRIGILSDTHGSITYFEQAMDTLLNCDLYFHGGDILYHGARNDLPDGYNPKLLAEKINDTKNIIFAKGNCESDVDQMVINHPIQSPYTLFQVSNNRFLICHGYTRPKEEIINDALRMGVDVLILGHTHIKELSKHKNLIVLNPGSTSIPKDGSHSVAIIDLDEKNPSADLKIEFRDILTKDKIVLK